MHAGTMLLHPHGILPMWAAVRGAAGGPRDSPEAHGGLEQTNSAGNELSSRAQDHSQGSQVTQVRFGDARMVFVLISFLVCVCVGSSSLSCSLGIRWMIFLEGQRRKQN